MLWESEPEAHYTKAKNVSKKPWADLGERGGIGGGGGGSCGFLN